MRIERTATSVFDTKKKFRAYRVVTKEVHGGNGKLSSF
jgi:hypothetical protein